MKGSQFWSIIRYGLDLGISAVKAYGLLVVIAERGLVGKQQPTAAFEIFALFRRQILLVSLSDVFQWPCTISDHIKSVNNHSHVFNEGLGNFKVFFVHP
jgi:hypothetical protein